MSKDRPRRKILAQDQEYKPGRTEAQRRDSHRRASLAYYWRHPEARERNRLRMRERRALTRAKRRSRDSAPVLASLPPSPPSDIPPLSPPLAARAPSSSPVSDAVLSHSTHHSISTRSEVTVNAGRPVRTALSTLAALNAAPLTEPTLQERSRWRRPRYPIYTTWLSLDQYEDIYGWSVEVRCIR
ncbi:hypothetical protein R3P38DRAFT_3219438 [Favolaschia claudopus]|uniref:Uncharacterized protein n=1 Tax=Favolaschia claudopus TaxID=2862362 RepID=A0AAW0A1W3_9AGAR